jgi:hypothetical protein
MAPRIPSTRKLAFTPLVVAFVPALGCAAFAPPTRVTVLHTTSADRTLREEGTNLNIDHWQLDTAPPGLEKGFFVVKSELEWHQRWPNTDTDKVPVLPADLNFNKEMLFVIAPTDHDLVAAELKTVVVNEGGIHAYINETVPGVDCPAPEKDAKPAWDIARLPLVEGKDVQFHIESSPGDSCGQAPEAKITCRAEVPGGDGKAPYQEKLNVDPGAKVSCIVGSFTSPRPVIDLTWTFAALPLGATTKMVVGTRGTAVSFNPDVFGTYGLQVEVLDDLQRRGASTTEVTVTPKAPLVVQLIWTKFDPDDDPSTFPRIELAALNLNADGSVIGAPPVWNAKKPAAAASKKGGPAALAPAAEPPLPGTPGAPPLVWKKGLECSLESAQPFCKAQTMGFTTVMTVDAAASKLFALGVHFTDDRVDGQAVPCVRTYRAGKLVADLCDTTPHKADTWWQTGVFDAETGKSVQTLAAERATAAAKVAADARAAADAKAAAEARAAAAKPPTPPAPSATPAAPAPPAKPAATAAPAPAASAPKK